MILYIRIGTYKQEYHVDLYRQGSLNGNKIRHVIASDVRTYSQPWPQPKLSRLLLWQSPVPVFPSEERLFLQELHLISA